ncbi:hypothetical protein BJX62DRAFT_214480 [Aspergillus germanicus]
MTVNGLRRREARGSISYMGAILSARISDIALVLVLVEVRDRLSYIKDLEQGIKPEYF